MKVNVAGRVTRFKLGSRVLKATALPTVPQPLPTCGPIAVWPDLAKFRHFGEILQYLPKDFKLFSRILQNLDPTLANLLCYWANIHVVNGQNWAHHLATWPHCDQQTFVWVSSKLPQPERPDNAQLHSNQNQKKIETSKVRNELINSFILFINKIFLTPPVNNRSFGYTFLLEKLLSAASASPSVIRFCSLLCFRYITYSVSLVLL